jgi:hypothetical protein
MPGTWDLISSGKSDLLFFVALTALCPRLKCTVYIKIIYWLFPFCDEGLHFLSCMQTALSQTSTSRGICRYSRIGLHFSPTSILFFVTLGQRRRINLSDLLAAWVEFLPSVLVSVAFCSCFTCVRSTAGASPRIAVGTDDFRVRAFCCATAQGG